MIPDLRERTVVVTGATSGLGLRSAQALAARGARVLLAGRSPAKLGAAQATVAAVATGPAPETVVLDLDDQAAVRRAAADVASRVDRLDVLMNNAGVMAVPEARTVDGFEVQLATNHLGHVALTGLLLPALLAAPAPRVVTTSSVAHRMGRIRWDDLHWERSRYSRWGAYGQSKLANLLFAFELDRRVRVAGLPITSVAAHPGYTRTNLVNSGMNLGRRRVGGTISQAVTALVAQSAEVGALPQLRAAVDVGVPPGAYVGPDGPMEMNGPPRLVSPPGPAQDPVLAARLWSLSEMATEVRFP